MKYLSNLRALMPKSASMRLVCALAALAGYFGYLAIKLAASGQTVGISLSLIEQCILSLLIAGVVLCTYQVQRLNALYTIVAIAGLIFAIGFPYFSRIDEGGHFQYVHYLATRHKLPTLRNYVDNEIIAITEHVYPKRSITSPRMLGSGGRIYEAHQPPLYYTLAAVIYTAIPGNLIVKLYGLRIAGVLAALLFINILLRTYRLLTEKNVLPKDDALFFGTALLLTLTPGFLLRMITLSNIHLLVPLVSLLIYLVIKSIYEPQITFRRHILPMGLLTGAAVLTHSIAAFIPPLMLIYVAAKSRSLKSACQFTAIAAAVTSPWFIHNWLTFGRLTDQQAAKQLLIGIVNPTHQRYGLPFLLDRTPRMFLTFWQPEEVQSLSLPVRLLTDLLSLVIIAAVVYGIAQGIRLYKNRKARTQVPALSAIVILINWAMLIAASLHESFDVMIGRYNYQTMLPAALLIFLLSGKTPIRRTLAIALVIAAALLWTSFLAGCLDMSTYGA